jgi:hypothetical protein
MNKGIIHEELRGTPDKIVITLPDGRAGYMSISDFSGADHTHDWLDITGKPTTLSGYGVKTEADGLYAPIAHTHDEYLTQPEGDALYSALGHTHVELHTHPNKTLLDSLLDNGDGTLFLSNDGTYKTAGPGDLTGYLQKTEPGNIVLKHTGGTNYLEVSPDTITFGFDAPSTVDNGAIYLYKGDDYQQYTNWQEVKVATGAWQYGYHNIVADATTMRSQIWGQAAQNNEGGNKGFSIYRHLMTGNKDTGNVENSLLTRQYNPTATKEYQTNYTAGTTAHGQEPRHRWELKELTGLGAEVRSKVLEFTFADGLTLDGVPIGGGVGGGSYVPFDTAVAYDRTYNSTRFESIAENRFEQGWKTTATNLNSTWKTKNANGEYTEVTELAKTLADGTDSQVKNTFFVNQNGFSGAAQTQTTKTYDSANQIYNATYSKANSGTVSNSYEIQSHYYNYISGLENLASIQTIADSVNPIVRLQAKQYPDGNSNATTGTFDVKLDGLYWNDVKLEFGGGGGATGDFLPLDSTPEVNLKQAGKMYFNTEQGYAMLGETVDNLSGSQWTDKRMWIGVSRDPATNAYNEYYLTSGHMSADTTLKSEYTINTYTSSSRSINSEQGRMNDSRTGYRYLIESDNSLVTADVAGAWDVQGRVQHTTSFYNGTNYYGATAGVFYNTQGTGTGFVTRVGNLDNLTDHTDNTKFEIRDNGVYINGQLLSTGGGGGGTSTASGKITHIVSDYTVLDDDTHIVQTTDNGITVTLPVASAENAGRVLTFTSQSYNGMTLSQSYVYDDSLTTWNIAGARSTTTLVSDGTQWKGVVISPNIYPKKIGAGVSLAGGVENNQFSNAIEIKSLIAGTGISLVNEWNQVTINATGGGGGVTTFAALTDTPATYAAKEVVKVNAAGTGLEYAKVDFTNINPNDVVFIDDIPTTEVLKLEQAGNWTGQQYTGPAITGTRMGQRVFVNIGGTRYRVEMETDNVPFRSN